MATQPGCHSKAGNKKGDVYGRSFLYASTIIYVPVRLASPVGPLNVDNKSCKRY